MSAYKQDPNDSNKQIPQPLSNKVFGYVNVPTPEVIHKVPSSVIINTAGTFAFAYYGVSDSASVAAGIDPYLSGSVGTSVPVASYGKSYITGSVLANAAGGPIRLDIQPAAWRRTDTVTAASAVGDVTFVYRGGK